MPQVKLAVSTTVSQGTALNPLLFLRSFFLFCIGHIVAAIGQFVKVQLHGGSAGQVPGASGIKAASGSQVEHAYIDVVFLIN